MLRTVRRPDLAAILEAVPDFPHPDPDREQYRTPSQVASDFLTVAKGDGAITGRHVVDLGCGTGVFMLGAVVLGAAQVTGIEADPAAAAVAQAVVRDVGGRTDAEAVAAAASVHVADIADPGVVAGLSAETVIMNPPFGAQHGNRHADRAFLDAARLVTEPFGGDGSIWFLAQPRTEKFLLAWARDAGLGIERIARWDYPIEARFPFHEEAVRRFDIAGYRAGPE